ncbi:MAG: hypothetical protein IKB23_05645, partial [Clostridia bacterium]|nr:hypothetical protein [Clostridia bacterium]
MGRIRKTIIAMFLALVTVVSMLPITALSASAATMPGEGMTFTADKLWALQKNITIKEQITFEAEVWIDQSNARQGIILGNYGEGDNKIDRMYGLAVHQNGIVRLYTNKAGDYSFKYDLRTATQNGEFAKIAVTVDCADFTEGGTTYTGKLSLYVNGEFKETIKTTDADMKSGWFTTLEPLGVG